MSKAQNRIDIEKDRGKIASVTLAMQPYGMSVCQVSNEIKTTVPDAKALLIGMVYDNVMYHDRATGYHLTASGIEYAEGLLKNSTIDTLSSVMAHKEEALTGIVTKYCAKSRGIVSERSKMTRAALNRKGEQREYKTPEHSMMEAESVRVGKQHLMRQLGTDSKTMDKYWAEGRIKECNGCGRVEVFDKDRDRLKHICRKCMKKRKGD